MTLSTCSGRHPSSNIITISELKGVRLRLAKKPSQLPQAAGALDINLPNAIVDAVTSGVVLAPFTTSKSFITLAGLKKCAPPIFSGRDVDSAI